MEKRKRIFVTGGSGFVGKHIVPILVSNGYEVHALARSESSKTIIEGLGAKAIEGDLLCLANNLKKVLSLCSYVLHIAAYMNITVDPKPFYDINVDATKRLVELSIDSKITKFIYISAAPIVSGSPVVDVNEITANYTLPPELYTKTKAIADKYVLSKNSEDFKTICLRPPAIWGPNNHHYDDLLSNVKSGNWRWINGGNHILSTIHVKNLASAILVAIKSKENGKGYFVTDGDRRSVKEFFTKLLNAEGLYPGNKVLPLWIASPVAYSIHYIWKIFNFKSKPPAAPLMIRLMGREFSVDDSLARDELEYKNLITFDEGILEIEKMNNSNN